MTEEYIFVLLQVEMAVWNLCWIYTRIVARRDFLARICCNRYWLSTVSVAFYRAF